MAKTIPNYQVAKAMEAIEAFCNSKAVPLTSIDIVTHMAIALHDQESFVWSPGGELFDTLRISSDDSMGRLVLVYKEGRQNRMLTNELNESIYRRTNGHWDK